MLKLSEERIYWCKHLWIKSNFSRFNWWGWVGWVGTKTYRKEEQMEQGSAKKRLVRLWNDTKRHTKVCGAKICGIKFLLYRCRLIWWVYKTSHSDAWERCLKHERKSLSTERWCWNQKGWALRNVRYPVLKNCVFGCRPQFVMPKVRACLDSSHIPPCRTCGGKNRRLSCGEISWVKSCGS